MKVTHNIVLKDYIQELQAALLSNEIKSIPDPPLDKYTLIDPRDILHDGFMPLLMSHVQESNQNQQWKMYLKQNQQYFQHYTDWSVLTLLFTNHFLLVYYIFYTSGYIESSLRIKLQNLVNHCI